MSLLSRYETKFKPFTFTEAWLLFRLSAYGEAVGWTLLITGIILKRTIYHGNDLPVLIAGRIHGTLFIIYMVSCIVVYPSLGWKRWQAVLAVAASVPPYGSVAFERCAALGMNVRHLQRLIANNLYRLCIKI